MKDAAEAEMFDDVGSCFDDPMQPAEVASYIHCCDLQGALLKIFTDITIQKGLNVKAHIHWLISRSQFVSQ